MFIIKNKRNILPLAIISIPTLISLILQLLKEPSKEEFNEQYKLENERQMENELFVYNDSAISFEGTETSLLSSSYFYIVEVEDLISLNNTIYLEDGFYKTVYSKIEKSEDEKIDINSFNETFNYVNEKECNDLSFKNTICGEYFHNYGDTLNVFGEIIIAEENNFVYFLSTQYSGIDKKTSDSLTNITLNKVRFTE